MVSIDTRAFRTVLGCYATGVAIITTRTPQNDPVGVTVNSFASVSLDPPLILFSLALSANVLAVFQQAEHFAVNILSHRQEALSNAFARPSTASWDLAGHVDDSHGCALFSECLATLECRKAAVFEGGDHLIFLGEVTTFHLRDAADPLLFYRGRYGTYARDKWSSWPPPDSALSDFSVVGWG